ncbi:MAG: hypothetical protein M2R45_05331 [Verrucomicrobia subdivision 3 bacterium]|nr:hypothetical protein [Limisphaerales bacterium]MCS1414950.1 hypothetical protein [Limisphaerales bacterium]
MARLSSAGLRVFEQTGIVAWFGVRYCPFCLGLYLSGPAIWGLLRYLMEVSSAGKVIQLRTELHVSGRVIDAEPEEAIL